MSKKHPASFRPTPELDERIRAYASRDGRTFSGAIVRLIEFALDDLERTQSGTQSRQTSNGAPYGGAPRGAGAAQAADVH